MKFILFISGEAEVSCALYSFSLMIGFCPVGFFQYKVFNEAADAQGYGYGLCTLFHFCPVLSHWVFRLKVFNEA